MEQLLVQFGDVEPFLCRDELGSSITTAKLLAVLTDPNKKLYLVLELAAVVDYGRPFITATYTLEGDGPLVLVYHEVIVGMQAAMHADHTPNVDAVARKLSSSAPHLLSHLKAYASRCTQPGMDYFEHPIGTSLSETMSAFKAARLFSPHKVRVMQPDASKFSGIISCVSFLKLTTDTVWPQGRTSFIYS